MPVSVSPRLCPFTRADGSGCDFQSDKLPEFAQHVAGHAVDHGNVLKQRDAYRKALAVAGKALLDAGLMFCPKCGSWDRPLTEATRADVHGVCYTRMSAEGGV